MALTGQQIETAAKRLDHAEQTRSQTGLMSLAYDNMTMDDAYAIQAGWVAHKLNHGRRVVGHKIGLTSKAMQAALNIDIPDSGVLFDDMLFESGSTIPQNRFIQPRVEAEIAFVMKHDLGGANITVEQVINAIKWSREAGIKNIEADFILGVHPDETMEIWNKEEVLKEVKNGNSVVIFVNYTNIFLKYFQDFDIRL